MNNDNFITIQGWMRNELNLKGNELMVYALIYGFSQDDESRFTGSVNYIADWIGSSRQTVHNILKSLCEKNFVDKHEQYHNGIKFCSYRTLHPVKKFDKGVSKNLTGGCQKTLHNNIENNNIKDIYREVPEDIKQVFMEWVDMRKGIKKPVMSKGTVTRALNKLNQLAKTTDKKIAVIQQSIDNCWQGFYPLKDNSPKKMYPDFKPEERKNDCVEMPEEIRERMKGMFG